MSALSEWRQVDDMELGLNDRATDDTAAQAPQPTRFIADRNQLSDQQRAWIAEAARKLRQREMRDATRTRPGA